jgi:hypothetical protein
MQNQELFNYIKENLAKGHNKEEIRKALLNIGWAENDINEAFNSMSAPNIQPPRPIQPPQPARPVQPSTQPSQPTQPTQTIEPKQDIARKLPAKPLLSTHKKSPKQLSVALAIIIGVLIIGGAVFGYFNYYKSPGNIIAKVMDASKNVKSLAYSGQVDLTLEFPDELMGAPTFPFVGNLQPDIASFDGTVDISINLDGTMDLNDPEESKEALKISLGSNMAEGKSVLEIISIGSIGYFKLDEGFDLGFIDISSVENQWFKVDPAEIKEQLGGLFGDQVSILDQVEEITGDQGISEEQKSLLEDIISKLPGILKLGEKLANEKMDDVDTYHYKFSLDKDGVMELLMSIDTAFPSEELSQEQLDEISTNLDDLDYLEGEVWIGEEDYLIRKISVVFTPEPSEEKTIIESVNFSIELSNYNELVQIDAPESSKSLQEFIEGLFSGLFSPCLGDPSQCLVSP